MTPHIEAADGAYANTVLMPGDPVRATHLAETFLTDVVQINTVRNCFGYTGYYGSRQISVQASGMGQASLSIYVHELFKFYNVQKIIRVGTCGSFFQDIRVGDVIVAMTAGTENSMVSQTLPHYTFAPCCDYNLLECAVNALKRNGQSYNVGAITASDYFYQDNPNWWKILKDQGVLGVDMETHILYYLAMKYGKRALTVNLVSNNLATHEELSSADRVNKLDAMVKSVLESLND